MEHISTVLVAIITAIPVVIGALLTYRLSIKRLEVENQKVCQENLEMKREMNVSATALSSFGGMMLAFHQIEHEIQQLCLTSPITRVVILCAWNGKFNPKWTTSVWQYKHMQGATPIQYMHVGLDSDYVSRLMHIKTTKTSLLFKTKDAPESLIKRIYESEKVEESLWCFLSAQQVANTEGRLITYMSFATTDQETYDENGERVEGGSIDAATRLRCELLAAKLAPQTGDHTDD